MLQIIFNGLVHKKQRIIRLFHFLWIIFLFLFIAAVYASVTPDHPQKLFWYLTALLCGKLAFIIFIITLLPGILKRFDTRNRILGLIMIFRRQFGITMFLLAAFHGSIVAIIPKLLHGPPFQLALFEFFGFVSVLFLFFLFITSNDFSQLKMGIWWYRLHRLVYLIMWLTLLHVALQRLSIWSILAVLLVTAEMTGIIYSNYLRNKPASIPH